MARKNGTMASSYDDQAEVASLAKVGDPTETFESLAGFGPMRFRNLDAMLYGALLNKTKGGELGRDVSSRASWMIKTGRLLTGRHVAHLLRQHLRVSEAMTMVYITSDLSSLKWMGESHEKVRQLKDSLGRIVGRYEQSS